jgi:hypothetical protein
VGLATAQAVTAAATMAPVQPADPASGLSPVSVVFPNTLAEGTTTLAITEQGPAPFPLYVHGSPARYYDLESTVVTSASVNDPIQVCIDYSGVQFLDEDAIALFHHEPIGWVDITSYRSSEQKKICGNTTSLSPFAIFEPANQPPVLPALPPVVLEAEGPSGATASLSAAGAYDPDRDPLTFEWLDSSGKALAEGGAALIPLPIGEHQIVLRARDRRGAQASTTVAVTVRDTTPPTLTVSAAPGVLWPPNHELVTVTFTLGVTDGVDPRPVVQIESVSCDDGCSPTTDIVGATPGTDDRVMQLRASRRGSGSGRTYTILYSATDASGNVGHARATVLVPHDSRGR